MILPLELLVVSFLTFLLLLLIIKFAPVLGLVDQPNERSFHTTLTPKGGGIAFTSIALAFISIINWPLVADNLMIFISIFLIMAVGIYDDVKDCSPKIKFIMIFVVVILLQFDNVGISTLGTYAGFSITIPALLVFPFTLFAIAGFTNSLNLIDGLDGLAGGVSLIILGTFVAIGIHFEDALILTLASTFIFTLSAFMVLNWHPAKIFMGDAGSLTLGFVISVLAIKSLEYINPTAVLFIAAIPLLDTIMVMLRRKQRSLSIFKADKNHMHHILYDQKKDVLFTTTMLWMLQLIFAIIGFRSIGQDDLWNVLLFVLLFFVFFSLFDPRLRKRKKRHKKSKKRSNLKEERDEQAK